MEEATFLTRYASKVLLFHRRDKLRAERVLQERLFASDKIEVVWNTVVEEIVGENKVQRLRTRNVVDGSEKTVEIGGIFIYVGFDPTSNIFRDPIEKDEMGFIITDDRMETSQPGIFCAGDVRHQFVRQITNATGDATTAAIAVTRLLESLADEERNERRACRPRQASIHSELMASTPALIPASSDVSEPVFARPSSTVILVRDGLDGVEMFLVRRHEQSGFANRAYVFPGGSVIANDTSDDSIALSPAFTPGMPRAFCARGAT